MDKFSFPGRSARRPMRPAPAKYSKSRMRGRLFVSESIAPAEAFYPYKHLPVQWTDVSSEDGVVINMGRIVSLITNQNPVDPTPLLGQIDGQGLAPAEIVFDVANSTSAQAFTHNLRHTNYTVKVFTTAAQDTEVTTGFTVTKAANTVTVTFALAPGDTDHDLVVYETSQDAMPDYRDRVENDGTVGMIPPMNSFFGYGDHIAGLLIPANGGVVSTPAYSALDVTHGTMLPDGTISDGTGNCALPANMPVGIVLRDIYQDIRGQWLNYQQHDYDGILCDGFIEVPYVDYSFYSGGTKKFATGLVSDDTVHATNDAGYAALNKDRTFFYFDGSDPEQAMAGQLVKSDSYGNYIPEESSADFAAPRSVQTVGRLMLTDNRFPKDMLDTVQTYPGSENPGTETRGLPDHLYFSAKTALTGMGLTATPAACLEAVQSGAMGLARILINVD